MWITFFLVPKRFGMVRMNYITRGDKMQMVTSDDSFIVKDDNIKTVIMALEEDNHQYKKMRKLSENLNMYSASELIPGRSRQNS
jgi:hypothetical protein